jgi:tRNA(fMet)-specific endonuclease VapC
MSTFVLDTNIISFYLKDNKAVKDNLDEVVAAQHVVLIPPFAWYEIQRGLLFVNSRNRMRDFRNFCKSHEVARMSNSILPIAAEIYAELQRIGRLTGDMDIFIAAFCKKYNYTLVTNNIRHFLPIPDILLSDWTV